MKGVVLAGGLGSRFYLQYYLLTLVIFSFIIYIKLERANRAEKTGRKVTDLSLRDGRIWWQNRLASSDESSSSAVIPNQY